METFVKLYSIIVIDALISGMWISITSGSGLARARPGTDSSSLPRITVPFEHHTFSVGKPRKGAGTWSMVTVFAGWLL